MAPRRPGLRLRESSRRIAALLMFVLHAGVGVLSFIDHDGRIPARHAEQRGNRHPRAHNERTCAVCAARVQQSAPVRPQPMQVTRVVQPPIEIASSDAPVARDPPVSNASRAPPPLS